MLDRTKVAFNAFWFENLAGRDAVASVCDSLAALGYKGVEWKETCFSGDADISAKLAMAARATRASGLEVTDFVILRNMVDPAVAPNSVADLCSFVRAAAAAGVPLVNTASSGPVMKPASPDHWWVPPSPDWTQSWDTQTRSLEQVLKVAEAEGVVIAFEQVVGAIVHDYPSIVELLRRLDSPSLALTFDPSHHQIYGGDVGYAIRRLGPRIRHVHVKDAVGCPGQIGRDFLFPLLGEGSIDWSEFFTALDDAAYGGWLSIEFESFKYMADVLKGDAVEAARLSITNYKALAGIP
jgi:sugar phosphate isomerase/epimerase